MRIRKERGRSGSCPRVRDGIGTFGPRVGNLLEGPDPVTDEGLRTGAGVSRVGIFAALGALVGTLVAGVAVVAAVGGLGSAGNSIPGVSFWSVPWVAVASGGAGTALVPLWGPSFFRNSLKT